MHSDYTCHVVGGREAGIWNISASGGLCWMERHTLILVSHAPYSSRARIGGPRGAPSRRAAASCWQESATLALLVPDQRPTRATHCHWFSSYHHGPTQTAGVGDLYYTRRAPIIMV